MSRQIIDITEAISMDCDLIFCLRKVVSSQIMMHVMYVLMIDVFQEPTNPNGGSEYTMQILLL